MIPIHHWRSLLISCGAACAPTPRERFRGSWRDAVLRVLVPRWLWLPFVVLLGFGQTPGRGCTIFVLTDAGRTLFFNNEDWSNPASFLWFVPAGPDHLGCGYVGFDDGWAQGGVNTAGLAFDWVAGAMERYVPDEALTRVRGNSAERMLERCTTVDEAIAFYRLNRETEFARARIMIADRTGASVIIGAKDGALRFDLQASSRGFGYGDKVLRQRLAATPEPTVKQGAEILGACIQGGVTPTQYSNIFDLRTGEILLYPAGARGAAVRFALPEELARVGHAFAMRELREPGARPERPLTPAQQRFYLDAFRPLSPDEPAVAARMAAILRAAGADALRPDDFTGELWSRLSPARREMRSQIHALGSLRQVTLVERDASANGAVYRCIAEFAHARVLQRFAFTPDGRVSALSSEFVERVRP